MTEIIANILLVIILIGFIMMAIGTIKDIMADYDEIEFLKKLLETMKKL